MRQRAITALFFTLTMLGGIYGGKHTFFALFAIVTAGCAWEFGGMAFKEEERFVLLRKVVCMTLPLLSFVIATGDLLKILPPSPLIILAVIFSFYECIFLFFLIDYDWGNDLILFKLCVLFMSFRVLRSFLFRALHRRSVVFISNLRVIASHHRHFPFRDGGS